MKLLTLLAVQALLIALLCPSIFTQKRIATLDGLIKTLGSLYQKQLFAVRDGAEEFENFGSEPDKDSYAPAEEVYETVKFPRQHICCSTLPYCVTFYSTLIIQDKPSFELEQEKKNIRNVDGDEDVMSCFSDIVIGSCPPKIAPMGGYTLEEVVDVSKLKVDDFCAPGTMKINGTLEVLNEITPDSTVYLEIAKQPHMSPYRRSSDDSTTSRCMNEGSYCAYMKTCDLIEGYWCREQRSFVDKPPLPCSCPVAKGVYNMDGFRKKVMDIKGLGTGKMQGHAIVVTKRGRTCFTFSFKKSDIGPYY